MLRPPLRELSDALAVVGSAKIHRILAHSQVPSVSDRALVDTVRDP
jgi:hypothetical protein